MRKNVQRFTLFVLLLMAGPLHAQSTVEVFVSEFSEHELRLVMENNASSFLSEVNTAFEEKREPVPADKNVDRRLSRILSELWSFSPFYIPDDIIIQNAAKTTSGYYEMRNIPIFFVDASGEEHYEEAVLQFTPEGTISEFRIGLAAHRYQELMNKGQDTIDRENRQQILTFVENFRTAYNRKDLQFIEDVFSDQALIIVGRVVQNTGLRSAFEDQVEEKVEFLQFNKDEYIDRLRHLFRINQWIEIGFEEIDIIRHPQPHLQDVYGVSLTQYYNSSIYSDVGHLFLLIDFKKPTEPMIHVRTWQPKREGPDSQRFSIGDLEIL